MKIHGKLIKSKTVTEKTDLWGNFITTILTRTGLHTQTPVLVPIKILDRIFRIISRKRKRENGNKIEWLLCTRDNPFPELPWQS